MNTLIKNKDNNLFIPLGILMGVVVLVLSIYVIDRSFTVIAAFIGAILGAFVGRIIENLIGNKQ